MPPARDPVKQDYCGDHTTRPSALIDAVVNDRNPFSSEIQDYAQNIAGQNHQLELESYASEDSSGSSYGDEHDSAFGDGSSYTSSLSSYVSRFVWENGRRYHAHKEGAYPLPNDEAEMEREDMKHHMMLLLCDGRLHLTPIGPNPQRILDVGTGTGIWAIQAATLYPSAQIIGTDLSPIQPPWTPPNLTFEIDDAEAEWLYTPSTFDFIHCRFLFLAIRDYPRLLQQAYRALKPGGFIQFCEYNVLSKSYDNTLPEPSAALELVKNLALAGSKMGLNLYVAEELATMSKEAGFINVTEQFVEFPMAGWPRDRRLKEAGMFYHTQIRDNLPGIAMGMCTRVLGWSKEKVEEVSRGVRAELDDERVHACGQLTFVYAQKPYE